MRLVEVTSSVFTSSVFTTQTEGADVLLAAACLAKDARALAYLEALLVNEVRRAVSPLDTTNVLVDEVTQLIHKRLLLPPARLAD